MATALEVIQLQVFDDINKLFVRPKFKVTPEDAIKQFKVSEHDVLIDKVKRPMQEVAIKSKTLKDDNGDPVTVTKYVDVVRVAIPWQEDITEKRIAFTLATPVKTDVIWFKETDKEKELVKMVERIQNDNKMDYKNKEILRRKLSECEVAVIWYYVDLGEGSVPRFTLSCKIVSPELGDILYPLFDQFGKMIAFRRDYKLTVGSKDIEHCDIYTAEFEYKYVKAQEGWILDPEIVQLVKNDLSGETELIPTNPVPNVALKILVEYYQQTAPVWNNVQTMIDRHEEVTSNHGDMNNKFGAPIFVIAGEFSSEVDNNKTGSILQLENGATADYAQLSSEPASIKLEQDNLDKYIHKMSQTPNISFDQMLTIGQMSGFAATMLFTDPHMAVRKEEETFGIGLQRRLNIIKHAIGALIDVSMVSEAKMVQLKPVITPYIPQNDTEKVDNLTVAKTGGIISTETAVEQNPLVKDSKVELQRLKNDVTNELTAQPNPNQPQ